MSEERLTDSDVDLSSVLVQALCRGLPAGKVSLDIHPDDEMLHFFIYSQGHPLEQAVPMYLESGKRIWATQRQVIAWKFGSPGWGGRILDFASGYGRVTRHIVAEVPAGSLWVADVNAEGVAFQQRALGVHGVVSTTDPERFRPEPPGTFDCILVSSLFTHLAEERFRGWLRRLGSLLSPGGLLLFSVHDLSLRRAGEPPPSGILFEATSESGSLAAEEYGTSWVSEAFVRSAIREAVGSCPVLRIPRGLASFQDLYLVLHDQDGGEPRPADAFAGLRLERHADGFVEHTSRAGERGLRLSGWAGDRVAGEPPREVRVRIDGELVAGCRDLAPRSIDLFAADPMPAVGWQVAIELPEGADADAARLAVSVVTRDGEELELYGDSILAALLRSAQLDAVALQGRLQREAAEHEALAADLWASQTRLAQREAQLDELGRRIRAMEASRFWKARNQWFKLKRLARLTTEP
jgi:SAM-dependent methyltransferase